MKRRLLIFSAGLLFLVVGLVLVTFQSDAVFKALVRQALPDEVRIDGVAGDLAGPVRLSNLTYQSPSSLLSANEVSIDWQPWALLQGTLKVSNLDLGTVSITTTESATEPAQAEPFNIEDITLPLDLVIDQVTVDQVDFDTAPAVAQSLKASIQWIGQAFETDLRVSLSGNHVELSAQADLSPTLEHQIRLQCECDQPLGQLKATIAGNQTLTRVAVGNSASASLVDATAYELLGDLRWELATDLPDALSPQIPASWALVASGNLQAFTLAGTLWYDGIATKIDADSLQLTEDGVELGSVKLTLPDHGVAVELNGQVPLQPLGELDLTGSWQANQDAYGPLDGNLTISGPLTGYQGQLSARNPAGDQSELNFNGDQHSLRVTDWSTQTEAGELKLTGNANWLDNLTWTLGGNAQSFDPGRWIEGWDGNLGAEVSGQGAGKEASLTLQTSGTLRDRPLAGQVEMQLDGAMLEVRAHMQSSDSAIDLALHTQPSLSGEVEFARVELAHWLADLNGEANGRLSVSGSVAQPLLAGEVALSEFDVGSAAAKSLRLQASPRGENNRINVTADSLTWGDQDWGQARLLIEGTLDAQQFELQLEDAPVDLQAKGASRLTGGADILLELSELVIEGESLSTWRLRDALALEKSGQRLTLAPSCLESAQGSICVDSGWHVPSASGSLSLHARAVPLLLPTGEDGTLTATGRLLSADVEFDNSGKQADEFVGQLTVSPGRINLGSERAVDLRKLQVSAEGDLDQLNVNADILLDELSMSLNGTVSNPTNQGVVNLSVSGRIPDLGVYSGWIPQLASLAGSANINLKAEGQINEPNISGAIALASLDAEVPDLGIHLTEGRLEAQFDGQQSHLGASFQSGSGNLEATGTIAWERGLTGDLKISGLAFQAVSLPELELVTSPDLVLRIDPTAVQLTGSVALDQAEVAIGSLSTAVPLSKDVTVVDDPQVQQDTSWPLEADIEFILGDAVKLKGYGLDVTLGGKLRVREQPGKPETGTGRVDLSGTYTAFGQELEIAGGRLLYAGDPLDDPALDLRARRLVDEIEAGIAVSGRARAPTIDIYSVPAMEQSEALSYLVLGRPLNAAGDGDTDLLSTAALGLGVAGSNRILSKLASGRGFASIGIANRQALGGAAFSVARYLSPRLYLSYSIGLEKAIDLVELQYQLSRRWSLESEVGEETRGKLKYKIERGRPAPAQ